MALRIVKEMDTAHYLSDCEDGDVVKIHGEHKDEFKFVFVNDSKIKIVKI